MEISNNTSVVENKPFFETSCKPSNILVTNEKMQQLQNILNLIAQEVPSSNEDRFAPYIDKILALNPNPWNLLEYSSIEERQKLLTTKNPKPSLNEKINTFNQIDTLFEDIFEGIFDSFADVFENSLNQLTVTLKNQKPYSSIIVLSAWILNDLKIQDLKEEPLPPKFVLEIAKKANQVVTTFLKATQALQKDSSSTQEFLHFEKAYLDYIQDLANICPKFTVDFEQTAYAEIDKLEKVLEQTNCCDHKKNIENKIEELYELVNEIA